MSIMWQLIRKSHIKLATQKLHHVDQQLPNLRVSKISTGADLHGPPRAQSAPTTMHPHLFVEMHSPHGGAAPDLDRGMLPTHRESPFGFFI